MITIKEIAKLANVSIGTVDRVLHNRGSVSSVTAKRIRKIVEESGYKPNLIARSLSLKKQLIIAILMPLPGQDNGYWAQPKRGILRAGQELVPLNVKVRFFHYNKYKEASFKHQFQQVKKLKPDGIFMAPVISSTAEKMLRAIPSGTPYLFFDANIEKSKSITFIGQNSYDSGVLAAELMKKIIHLPGTIAAIQPLKDDHHILQRIEGFCGSIKASKDFRSAVYLPKKGGDAVSFRRLLKQIIDKNSDIRGIFVSNAACHYAADYLVNHSLSHIKLIGYDLIKKNVHHLKNGVIDFLVCQRPENQGFEGIHILHRFMAFGEKVEKQICMPLDIVTAENLKYYQYV